MQVEVKVPQLSESVSEATLVAWRKKAGEAVKRDENLIDVETDKGVLELPAAADGGLRGEVMARIDTPAPATAKSVDKEAVAPAKVAASAAAATPAQAGAQA